MCTWLAAETIEYYLRNGSNVFASWIWLRHLTRSNKVNFWESLWGNVYYWRCSFPVTNGVKQGAVILFYTIYTSTASLFVLGKRKQGVGWMALRLESLHTQMAGCCFHQPLMDHKKWQRLTRIMEISTPLRLAQHFLRKKDIWRI